MQETITITLPAQIKPALDEVRQREGTSLNELVTKAIEEYLFARQFRLLRERMVPKAQEQGIYTDQDVFERVS
jgi:metal-responsive CopG/Arc/MetJ family transcriptional regulator